MFQKSGFPEEKLIQVEDLRSLNLLGRQGIEKRPLKSSDRTLLVITGIMPIESEFQLNLLKDASIFGGLNNYSNICIKPHPDLPIEELIKNIKVDFNYEITYQPLEKLWSKVDVIYCANSTSVSAEASWLGFPVIITSPKDTINLNPLYGIPGFKFISSGKLLSQELQNPQRADIPNNYFCLDEKLTLWWKLLEDL